jgi:hypothetical protein
MRRKSGGLRRSRFAEVFGVTAVAFLVRSWEGVNSWRWGSTTAQVRRNSVTCTKDALGRCEPLREPWRRRALGLRAEVTDTCLKESGCLAVLTRKTDGKTRSFCGVGCTTVLRFDLGVVFHVENEAFSCDKLRASRPTPAASRECRARDRGGLRLRAGRLRPAGQSVYYYTLYFLRCQVEKVCQEAKK